MSFHQWWDDRQRKGKSAIIHFSTLQKGVKCAETRNSSNNNANSPGMNFVMENKLIANHWGWRSGFRSFTEFVTTILVKILFSVLLFYFIFCNWIVGKISNMCLNNRAIFLSSPGTVLGIVYLEHDFNFNSWTISNKIKHHFVSDSYHNAKTASNKYFKWSQSSTPPTPPQLLQFEGRTMDWTCLK